MKKLTLLTFVCLFSSVTCVAQDWPQWRGVNRDGKVTGFTAPQVWPGQLTQSCKVVIGSGDATPALVNNRLYVFSRQEGNEVLRCLDAISGKQIWKNQGVPSKDPTGPSASHPGPRSSVAVSDGKVITLGLWGDICCYDASDGSLLWKNDDYKGQVPQFGTGMSPLIDSGTCYADLGGPEKGTFIAFDLGTGSVKWKVEGEGPSYASPVLLTIDGNKQIVFQSLTKQVSFNTAHAKLLWEQETPVGSGRVQIATTPVVYQNKVFFTGLNNGVNAIEVKKQGDKYAVSQLWKNPDLSTGYNTPIIKDGYLYGFSGQGGKLFCINISNGATAWISDITFQSFGSLVDAGSVIIGLSGNSKFVVLRPDGQKYNQEALIELPEKGIYAYPVLSGKRIYIKDADSLIMFTL